MRSIPKKMRSEMSENKYMKICMRNYVFNDHECEGRITWEHAFTYAGRQINEKWAIISICREYHLNRDKLDKRMSEFIAVFRASEEELQKYPRKDWDKIKERLKNKFGENKVEKVKELTY